MSELEIFIDESGDTGLYSDFYIVTMVFKDSQISLAEQTGKLSFELGCMGLPEDFVFHAGPIIRREKEFKAYDLIQRRKLLYKLFAFFRHSKSMYRCFVVDSKTCSSEENLRKSLVIQVEEFLSINNAYFSGFDKVIVYYDNGQSLVTELINTVLCSNLNSVVIKRIQPADYRLSQVADMICTLELLRQKIITKKGLSHSEQVYFESKRRLERIYLRGLIKQRFEDV